MILWRRDGTRSHFMDATYKGEVWLNLDKRWSYALWDIRATPPFLLASGGGYETRGDAQTEVWGGIREHKRQPR